VADTRLAALVHDGGITGGSAFAAEKLACTIGQAGADARDPMAGRVGCRTREAHPPLVPLAGYLNRSVLDLFISVRRAITRRSRGAR
jgi:hypothetical protein